MTNNGEHPENLLWFVAGEVESGERERVLQHLDRCDDCRAEATAFASMMKSIVAQSRLDHVPAEDLVLFEEKAAWRDSVKGNQIREHLEECQTCREELESIVQARQRETVADRPLAQPAPEVARQTPALRLVSRETLPGPGHRTKRRWWMAAAAGIVLAVAVGVAGVAPRPQGPVGPMPMKLVVLGAPQRGADAAGRFVGSGPWAAHVLLPYGVGAATFRVTIRRENQEILLRFDGTASSDAEGCLDVIVPDLPSLGRYELRLTPLSGGDSSDDPQELIYPFEHFASAPDPMGG